MSGARKTSLVRTVAIAALASSAFLGSFFERGLGSVASAAGAFPEKDKDGKGEPPLPRHFAPEEKTSIGSVTVHGQRIPYRAVAGSLVVHPKGWDDTTTRIDMDAKPGKGDGDGPKGEKEPTPEASMFFVAYFKQGARPETRPITFIYNGGPGSASLWLHMGAFGPKRVGVPNDQHMPAAPYALVNNDDSLLDASDLVFIDMPGAGFSRMAGPGKEHAFWGVDQDAYAFSDFIAQFLGKYARWNSPKYLFGESYGTTRSAVLINMLETQRSIDFNGVILLSQILNFALSPDGPEPNPGVELPYELALPTFAATAWYHHKLEGNPTDLKALIAETEHFAMTDYALALQQGSALSEADRTATAAKLHKYIGLPVDYIRKANLRITGGVFEKALLDGTDTTTGRIDTRFAGPAMDPLEKNPDYDPSTAAFGSAYVSAFNDYVRRDLKYGEDRAFKLFAEVKDWNGDHDSPAGHGWQNALNVMPDLATAMKYNPNLHVQLNAGYFDLATPFYQGVYEMEHLPIPSAMQKNIEYKFYESGHMVYAVDASRKALHDNVADFIRRTVGAATP